jgi:hypothetical protein
VGSTASPAAAGRPITRALLTACRARPLARRISTAGVSRRHLRHQARGDCRGDHARESDEPHCHHREMPIQPSGLGYREPCLLEPGGHDCGIKGIEQWKGERG